MGIDNPKGCVFGLEMGEDTSQHDMFEHVGEIAGVEGVAIVHAGSPCASAGSLRLESASQPATTARISVVTMLITRRSVRKAKGVARTSAAMPTMCDSGILPCITRL